MQPVIYFNNDKYRCYNEGPKPTAKNNLTVNKFPDQAVVALQQLIQLRPCCGPGGPFWYTGPATASTSKSATVWFITSYVLRLRRRRLLAKATTVKVLIINIRQNSVVSTANRISSSTSSGILWLKGHSCEPCACNIWLFPNGTFDNNKISLSLGIQRQKFLTRLLSLSCWLGSCL